MMKKYLLLSLLWLLAVANVHGEGSVGEIGETGIPGVTGISGYSGFMGASYAFHSAIRQNNMSEIKRLITSGADVNKKDQVGYVPLLWAILSDNIELVRLLIDAGADVNIQGTPLLWATFLDNAELVLLLIDAGADVNALNDQMQTSLDIVRHDEAHNEIVQRLIQAGGRSGSDVYWSTIKTKASNLVRATSIVIPPVMVALQFLIKYWIHNRINTDPDFRRVTALNLLHETTFASVTSNVPQLGDLVFSYIGKNID